MYERKHGKHLPFIIAEIGINHNGDLEIAKKLIDLAVEHDCDAVKFQKRTIDTEYTQEYLAGQRESPWGTTQREQKEGLEFGKEEYDEIDAYCESLGILWSASAWDTKSQEFLNNYELAFNKVASAMVTHTELLHLIAKEGKQTFISTGMCTYEEIDTAVDIFNSHSCPFTLLHCVSTYPCREEDCNIAGVTDLRNRYNCAVGYSGHESGVLPSVIAVALGAEVIERHITLDKNMYGSDQSASLEPEELAELVSQVRKVDGIMGTGQKTIIEEEKAVAKKLRYFEELSSVAK